MRIYWKRFVGKTGFWLVTEIGLNLLGLDNLADYSEFVFDRELELYKKNHRTVKVTPLQPKFCLEVNEYCPISEVVRVSGNPQKEVNIRSLHIIQHKCDRLQNPCIKVWCLTRC
ncbi:MAG: hypothetical protein SVX43_05695 [Cyanobacteriota bacterium]|nr:hypothetical protein [Cyanobacteriota bacterium]